MNLEAMIKSDLSLLEGAIRDYYITPYDAVELMGGDLRGWLMAALYAYSANADVLTDGEYFDKWYGDTEENIDGL